MCPFLRRCSRQYGATRIRVFTYKSVLPFQVSLARATSRVPHGLTFGRQKSHLSGTVVLTPFSAAFTLKHRECKQSSARRRGGPLLRGSAPKGVLVPPTSRAPSKKADLGTWELSHTRALRVVCLERLRASKELFRCTYMLSGIALGGVARQ